MKKTLKRSIVALIGISLAASLAACDRGTPSRPQTTPRSQEGTGSGGNGDAVSLDRLRLTLDPVVTGLERPLFVANAADGSGRLFVLEQPGTVRVVRDGKLSTGTFLDLKARVSDGGERGLLGLAFSPQYRENGTFYVNYTDKRGDTVVVRYTADDPASDSPKLSAPEMVLKVAQPYANHNGGCMAFGPDDRLYIGLGDGGSGGDPQDRAQDDSSLLGKLLAIDVEKGERKPAIVAKGLRNPWRFSFDAETDELWIGDVGQNAWEEIDLVSFENLGPDLNFGWNRWEGNHPYPPDSDPSKEGFTFPVIEHARDEAQSITGGYVYRGEADPALQGFYIYGDFAAGWIGAARRDGEGLDYRIVLPDSGVAPASFGEGEDGELYVCDYGGGAVLRVRASTE